MAIEPSLGAIDLVRGEGQPAAMPAREALEAIGAEPTPEMTIPAASAV